MINILALYVKKLYLMTTCNSKLFYSPIPHNRCASLLDRETVKLNRVTHHLSKQFLLDTIHCQIRLILTTKYTSASYGVRCCLPFYNTVDSGF